MRRVLSLLFIAAVVAAVPAQAQDEPVSLLPFEVHVGGGYTFSMSDVRQYLGDGYHVNVGLTLNPMPNLGLQLEYSYTGLGKRQVNVPGTPPAGAIVPPIHADMNMQYLNANVLLKPRTSRIAKPYVLAGIGAYYRPVTVTAPAAGYVPGYCSPWYYTCWPGGTVVVDQVLASGSATNFGVNFGGGVYFLMGREAGGGFYIESRYHYIWGPEVLDSTGASRGKANGQFLPITIGLRF